MAVASQTTEIITSAVEWLWQTLGRDFAEHVASRDVDEAKWRNTAQRYYISLYKQVGFVRVLGKMESQSLERIYTDVNVLDRLSVEQRYSLDYMREHFGPRSATAQMQIVRKDGLAVLQQHNHLFILGKPGAGKTTFLKWAALQAVRQQLDYFPIFVTLKTLSDKRPNIKTSDDILDYLAHRRDIRRLPSPKTFIEYVLESGKALILFDGLDEVNLEDNRRADLVDALNDFVSEYGNGKTLITCRVAATEYSFTRFEYVEMADFTPQQMGTFIDNWFSPNIEKARRCHNELIDKRGNEALQELAQIPLLMTLLCLTFEELNAFPVKRSQIYDEATRALLSKWDASRNIRRDIIYRGLDLQEKKWMLAAVAAHTFERGDYFVEEGEMTALLEDALRSIPNIDNPDGQVVLKAIEAQHGILVERARRIHSFSHLTLQEYFTALNIVENARHKNYLPALMEHITDSRWREVFLLTAGMLRSADDFFVLFKRELYRIIAADDSLLQLLRGSEQLVTETANPTFGTRLFTWFIGIAYEAAYLLLHEVAGEVTGDTLFLSAMTSASLKISAQTGNEIAYFGLVDDAMNIIRDIAFALSGPNHDQAVKRATRRANQFQSVLVQGQIHLIVSNLAEMLEAIEIGNRAYHEGPRHSERSGNRPESLAHRHVRNLQRKMRAAYQLADDWRLDHPSFGQLTSIMTAIKLFVDCLQVANMRNRQQWRDQLLKPPAASSAPAASGLSGSGSLLSIERITQSQDITRLQQWLKDDANAAAHGAIERQIRFLTEKQRIFYRELPLALRGAFSVADFDRMLITRCGRRRDEITTASGLRRIVVDIIEEAERHGWLIVLVKGAYVANQGNKLLRETHDEAIAFLNEFGVDEL